MSDLSLEQLHNIRHSTEHVLTQAMQKLYGSDKIIMAMGPATDDGFYFDFDTAEGITITEADFGKIEKEMWKIINKDLPITRKEIDLTEAKKLFKGNPYKQEWLDQIESRGEKVTIYWTGDEFVDLCAGPHAESTKAIKAFKLLSIAGAYWHGDEKNKMLTRIYGTAFSSGEDLKQYLWQIEEAKKRDHRKLGKELDLFVFSELVGPGLPLYTHKGALIRRLLQQHVNDLQKQIGYQEVWTPQVTKADLFKTSGHYDKYQDSMFRVKSSYTKDEYFLKPMNCPNHCVIFGSRSRSYKDLPIRFSDFANLYRDEKPGELSGLTRLRAFSQDDGHCFCREDQIENEFVNVIRIIGKALEPFQMRYWIRLSLWDSTHPEKYLGEKSTWEKSQAILEDILKKEGVSFRKVEGEAAIYGPKMDFIAVDSLGREWQISTVQLDLIMPSRFGLVYTDADGQEKTPIMIHRAILGSPERFMGLLIEHLAGAFPLWLAPTQAVVIPISEDQAVAAKLLTEKLADEGIRVELLDQAESMQKKIRNAEKQKVPYMLVVGAREAESNSVSVRARSQKDLGVMDYQQFLDHFTQIASTKSLGL